MHTDAAEVTRDNGAEGVAAPAATVGFTAPSPVAYITSTSSRNAWLSCVTSEPLEAWKIAATVRFLLSTAVNIPGADVTTGTLTPLLMRPALRLRMVTVTRPAAAVGGSCALICVGET